MAEINYRDQLYHDALLYGLHKLSNDLPKVPLNPYLQQALTLLGVSEQEIPGGTLLPVMEQVGRPSSRWVHHVPPVSLDIPAGNKTYRNNLEGLFPFEGTKPVPIKNLKALGAEYKLIDSLPLGEKCERLLPLLEKHTSSISCQKAESEISYYDMAKMRAAISVSLWLHQEEGEEAEPFLVLGSGFSGIQSYIYNIVSKNANKNLKGRSFYLQLLNISVQELILQGLGLHPGHVVYASGGGLMMILPNTPKVHQELINCTAAITQKLFQSHKTALYLTLDLKKISGARLLDQFDQVLRELNQKLAIRKKQKFASHMIADYSMFFEASEAGGEQPRDVITGEEINTQGEAYFLDPEDATSPVSKVTYDQIKLGTELKNAEYWIIARQKPQHAHLYINPANLGIWHRFIKKADKKELLQLPAECKAFLLNRTDFLTHDPPLHGFLWYGGNRVPNNTEFLALAGGEETAFNRLGVLRMDVDSLGLRLQEVAKGEKGLMKFAAFSRNLDYFFKGYLNQIWDQSEEYRRHVFVIYSGGDDLFILGKWDVMIRFAQEVREELRRWTANNPHLTISGGLAINHAKYPIAKLALQAADAEDEAKAHVVVQAAETKSKDSFTFLGRAMRWQDEFQVAEEFQNEILRLLEKKKLPMSIINKIRSHYTSYYLPRLEAANREIIDEQEKRRMAADQQRWHWVMAYDLSQTRDRTKDSEVRALLERIKQAVFTNGGTEPQLNSNYHFLEILAVAARWAEFSHRSSKTLTSNDHTTN